MRGRLVQHYLGCYLRESKVFCIYYLGSVYIYVYSKGLLFNLKIAFWSCESETLELRKKMRWEGAILFFQGWVQRLDGALSSAVWCDDDDDFPFVKIFL